MAARLTTYLVVAIVSATLIAGLMVGAQRDDNEGPVDLIVHNANVYTADADQPTAQAIAIRGNQVLRVGSNREISKLQRPQTTMIDAHGAAVLPGFNDAHVRLMEGALALGGIDLAGAATVAEVTRRVRAWADANADAAWIVGRGWSRADFEGGAPAMREALDGIAADRPVQLLSRSGREAWVNSLALKRAGIGAASQDPPGGLIERDARTGEPTGLLEGSAVALVAARLPQPDRDARARALRDAVKEAHRLGITSVQDIGAAPADIALYDDLRRAGDLDLRIYAALAIDGTVDEPLLARIGSIWKDLSDDARLKTGAVALTLDNVESGKAARLPAAGGEAGSSGAGPAIAPDDLNRFVRLLDAQGWHVATVAEGDRTVRMALNAYLHAARSNPAPERERRHRVEGASIVDAEDLPRFNVLGALASVQPSKAAPIPALRKARARLAFGSGWPAGPLDPMASLGTAVTAAEPVALETAIDGYTAGAAYASFDEQRKGTITAGMLADIVVLSADIFDLPAARIAATPVAVTIFDGKIVYRRDAKSSN